MCLQRQVELCSRGGIEPVPGSEVTQELFPKVRVEGT